MFKFLKHRSLPGVVILGISLVLADAVAAAPPQIPVDSAPSDAKPIDATAQSQQSLERYGCVSGYSDRTYRGNQSVNRYEFAAALNACLNRVEQLINGSTSDRVTQAELAVPKRELETLRSELERLRTRVDNLDGEDKHQ